MNYKTLKRTLVKLCVAMLFCCYAVANSAPYPFLLLTKNPITIAYIYGYNNSLVIAKAVQAKSNEIAYEGWEESTSWVGYTPTYDISKANTGKRSARIDNTSSSEQISQQATWLNIQLTAPGKFRFSGWIYSNGPSAEIFLLMKRAGETGYTTYFDRVEATQGGKWIFVEKEATVPADVTQLAIRIDNNGGGSVWFDDLRLHPSNALMTTYTYDPLVGKTSETDASSITTYYEYDEFNRLKNIKDRWGNILQNYIYHYKNQY